MYPGADAYALHDVSFKIMPGELCVRFFFLFFFLLP
jgi:hypothetical protein